LKLVPIFSQATIGSNGGNGCSRWFNLLAAQR
jgi:hypothetical protein